MADKYLNEYESKQLDRQSVIKMRVARRGASRKLNYSYNACYHKNKDGMTVKYDIAPIPRRVGELLWAIVTILTSRPDLRRRYFEWLSALIGHLIYHNGEARVGRDHHLAMGAPANDSQRKRVLQALGSLIEQGGYDHGNVTGHGAYRLYRLTEAAVALINEADSFYSTTAEFESRPKRPRPKRFNAETFKWQAVRLGIRISLSGAILRVVERFHQHGFWFDRVSALKDPVVLKDLMDPEVADKDKLRTRIWRMPHGVIFARYRLARSGRLYTYDVNLQGLPKVLRKYVRPVKPGRCFVYVDYATQEPRVVAYLSGDVELLRAIESRLYESLMADVPGLTRPEAKEAVNALNYGATMRTVVEVLTGHAKNKRKWIKTEKYTAVVEQARKIVVWHQGFKTSEEWKRREATRIVDSGEAMSLLDGTVRTKDAFDLNENGKVRWRRKSKRDGGIGGAFDAGVNHVIQATCADMLRRLLVDLEEPLGELDACVALPIHDGLLIECPIERRDEVESLVVRFMEQLPAEWFPGLSLPAEVDSWANKAPHSESNEDTEQLDYLD